MIDKFWAVNAIDCVEVLVTTPVDLLRVNVYTVEALVAAPPLYTCNA